MLLAPFLPLLLCAAQDPTPSPVLPTRPRDPFVFRCVLDRNPRMLVVALHDELWAAYDTETCGLVQAWKGGVHFDGPVYTTVHGPQPTVQGTTYTTGTGHEPAWSAYEAGHAIAVHPTYAAYRVDAGRLAIVWRLELADGRVVTVLENPEYATPRAFLSAEVCEENGLGDGTQPGLFRRFEAQGLPAGVQVNLTLRTDGALVKLSGALERERFEDVKDEKGNVVATRIWSQLPFTSAAPANSVALFFAPPPPPAPNANGGAK